LQLEPIEIGADLTGTRAFLAFGSPAQDLISRLETSDGQGLTWVQLREADSTAKLIGKGWIRKASEGKEKEKKRNLAEAKVEQWLHL